MMLRFGIHHQSLIGHLSVKPKVHATVRFLGALYPVSARIAIILYRFRYKNNPQTEISQTV